MPDESALFALAARQHAVFNRAQARVLGFDRAALARRVDRGRLLRITADVLAVAGAPRTERQTAMAAVLDSDVGAALSHASAAALWALPGFALTPPQVLVSRRRHAATSVLGRVHTSTHLPAHHLSEVDGIAVTTPTRLAFDLSGRVHPYKLERTIENMWSRRLTNGPRLYRMLDELSEHGRPRIQAIRDYLEPRGASYVPMESGLEMRLNSILAEDGQKPLDRQVDVGDEQEWIGRVDFLDRVVKLIVEVDSELYHGSDLDRRLDAERRKRLADAGWTIVSIREFDIWHNKRLVAETIRSARHRARLGLAAA